MLRVLSTCAFALLAGPAAADWAFRPSEASDDLGSAYVRNSQGHTLDVGCGNSGEIALQITPDISRQASGVEAYTMVFEGERGMLLVPLTCEQWGCSSDSAYPDGQVWTQRQKEVLIDHIRRAPKVSIWMHATDEKIISEFSLTGSTAALGKLAESARGCIGL
ncbi:hypothetical protein OCH239_09790 [Roseivivax halodurans JCM 10272]|uniref:Uncharacterized protein n=1 Tax=Roseivivax halodurans JCM 10272 TaxID=1449350 RepID=X7EEC0_9RHOB|nr:hypothetical protein [Roseivivax halodurans]ETX13561.1 hypothetical protein OCH239_09790 [Roseivivax halodurans JCM 10272]